MAPVKTPLVSVIVPVYNGERYLRAALDSAIAQTYNHTEVIVVDDGSTDRSPAILNEYGHRIRVLSQQNAGRAAARNRGILESRGEWIALLDQDDLWDPQKLKVQLSAAQPGDSVVHSDVRVVDQSGAVTKGRWLTEGLVPFPQLADVIRQCPVLALTAMIRRDAVLAAGGFDEANRYGTDDWQLWLGLAAMNHRFRKAETVLASYRLHGENASLNRPHMALGDIYALQQTRLRYRKAFGKKETRAFHRRLHRIYFDLAWHQYDRGEYAAAARNFRCAVRHDPHDLRSWAHALASSLPFRSKVVPKLRALVTRRGTGQENNATTREAPGAR